MNAIIYWTLLGLIFLMGCKKEELTPGNYMKAEIDGRSFLVYQDNAWNNDTVPNSFSFSFGKNLSKGNDTSLFLLVSLNGQSLYLSFPKPTADTSFVIYRRSDVTGKASAYYSMISSKNDKMESEMYVTENLLKDVNIENQPVGEIVIDKIDKKKRVISGHFYFSASGFTTTTTETIVSNNKTIRVTNGWFHCLWDESLDI